jgi:guanyl-specific ribonuclease Sa
MPSASSKSAVPTWLRVVVVLAVVAAWYMSRREANVVPKPAPPPEESKPIVVDFGEKESTDEKTDSTDDGQARKAQAKEEKSEFVIRDVTLKDQSGRVIFRGDIDLQPTLDRIAAGKLFDRFPNDGSVFQNRERRLPKQPSGYYHEYVVPTPDQSGPGPQRLVIGKEGELYYTSNHYQSFRKVR